MRALYLLLLFFISFSVNAQTTWNGTSWDNDAPNNTLDAIITGAYDTAAGVHGEFTAKNLNITATGSLTISANTTLTIQTNLDNLGSFTIQDKGSLFMIDDAGTVTGVYTVNKNTPDYPVADINSFYSSPVIEADSNMASVFNSDDIVFYWDTSANPTYWVGPLDKSITNFGLGKGYAARPDNTSGIITRTFTGQLNTGDISVPVYFSDSSTSPGQFGYNIIGNPYPSAIDWFAFKADNASLLGGTMYYWRQLETGINYASNYVALNALGVVPYNAATEFIGSAQGFVVRTNATSNVVFKNSHRVAGNNDQFFRGNLNSRQHNRMMTQGNSWFILAGSTESSVILIGFNTNATTAFDTDYDGIFIGGADPLQLYSLSGTDKLLINGQPELTAPNNVSVPLGIKTMVAGNYTMSIDQEFIGSEYFIKLEDTETSTTTDLRLSDYSFSVTTPGENNSRFIIHYEYDTTLSVDDELNEEYAIKTFFNGDDLEVKVGGNNLPNTVEIYGLQGNLLFRSDYNSILKTPNLSSGVYLIKVNFDNLSSISKTVVKK